MAVVKTQKQRGFSLLVAMTLLTLLTFLGLMVWDTVAIESQSAGSDRRSINALYIAEAGMAWGLDQLATYSSADVLLNDYSGSANVISNFTALNQWFELNISQPLQNYTVSGTTVGQYRVAILDDDDEDPGVAQDYKADKNQIVLIRSLGVDTSGARRMIEAAVKLPSP